MANRFNRGVRGIRDIDKVPFYTNEQNDLLQTLDDKVYVRLSKSYERITGLPALEEKVDKHIKDYKKFKKQTEDSLKQLQDNFNQHLEEYKGFKKQTENSITNLETELNEYIENTDVLLQNMEKEHQDKIDQLDIRIKALENEKNGSEV